MELCDGRAVLALALEGGYVVTCSDGKCEMWKRLLKLRRWSDGLLMAAS
jgi:hypothetical protein